MSVDLTPPVVTTADIAATIPARTVLRGAGGGRATDFADDGTTQPSKAQVQAKINTAAADVFAAVGVVFAANGFPANVAQETVDFVKGAWKNLVIYRAVYLIEKTYWPEQLRDEANIANSYLQDYNDGLAAFRLALDRIRNSETGDGTDSDAGGIGTSRVMFDFSDGDECRVAGAAHPGGYVPDEAWTYNPHTETWKLLG